MVGCEGCLVKTRGFKWELDNIEIGFSHFISSSNQIEFKPRESNNNDCEVHDEDCSIFIWASKPVIIWIQL